MRSPPLNASFDIALGELLSRPHEARPLPTPVPVDALPTPALLLDEAALERNLERMARHLAAHGKAARPHAKMHKCPIVAARQLAAGAVGICAAKVSEAAVLVNAGIGDVLITSPIVGTAKAALVVRLAGQANVDIVVDGEEGLNALEDAVGAAGGDSVPGVLIDIDVNMGRTGTRDRDLMLRLAERISAHPQLRFRGVQHYAGQVMHIEGHSKRREASLALWDTVAGHVASLASHGFDCAVVTGGGTGTYDIDCHVDVLTDLQVGSYAFMDHEYRLIGGASGALFDDFEIALTVAATAISQPRPGAVTLDSGFKAFATDSVKPEPLDLAGSRFRFGGDEHGILLLEPGTQQPLLGAVQRFVTPHCDPTVNLYDAFWVHRDGMVHSRWPIAARGCSW